MPKTIELPSDAVVFLVARAQENGPLISINIDKEWWAGATKDHRKALFIACVQTLGQLGMRVIPEEFGPEVSRPLDPLPEELQ